jgi:ubiquinone/menaquinone biosynthesis C-methylase UbiE
MNTTRNQSTDDDWERKRKISSKYDLLASVYEEIYRNEQLEKYREVFSNLRNKTRRVCVEVGCGTGIGLEASSESFRQIWVGIDISIGMLREAKRRILPGEKRYIVLADSDFIPLREKCTDLAICITVLSRTPRPVRTIKELRRIVISDGEIVLSVLKRDFTADKFRGLIREAGLEILDKIKNNKGNKDHFFFCSGI